MARTDYQSVDEYLATQPAAARRALETVRGAIRKALPDAEEVISYQIPAYRLHGGVVLYVAGWTEHVSIYPASPELVAAIPELADRVVSKGTIRFPLSARMPVGLIGRVARFNAKQALERQEVKRSRTAARKASKPAKPSAARAATKQG
jgi:uncharacterized protein YdhG (YjbR/CyaY superfamily)